MAFQWDAEVVFVTSQTLLLRLAIAILCRGNFYNPQQAGQRIKITRLFQFSTKKKLERFERNPFQKLKRGEMNPPVPNRVSIKSTNFVRWRESF